MSDKATPIQPRRLKDIQHWDYETDVVIVGFGGAGACAAIEAADAGAEATIFEVASASGGSTALSSAEVYMGGNGGTPIQKACGFEDSTDAMVTYLMDSQGPQADEAKIRLYCEKSTEHYEWLVRMGAEYKESFHEERAIMALTDDCLLYTGNEKAWPFRERAKPCPRGHNLKVEGDNGGPLLMGLLTRAVEERNNVTVHYETRALTLIADDNNEVHGLVVRQDGEERTVKARKGVILCAGGFVMNEKMLQQHVPRVAKLDTPIGNPFDTGSGILMGLGVGASAINMHECFASLPFYPPAKTTFGILITGEGHRFVNEDCYHGRVGTIALKQHTRRLFWVQEVEGFEPMNYANTEICGTGETVAELEEELGIPEGQLQHTLDFYNRHAAEGRDPLFHKADEFLKPLNPPLVAVDCTPGRGAFWPFFTLGGLDTLPTGEVLTPLGDTIPGLYAAGRTACGIPRRGDGYGSGMSVGDATFFGRVAGQTVAQRDT